MFKQQSYYESNLIPARPSGGIVLPCRALRSYGSVNSAVEYFPQQPCSGKIFKKKQRPTGWRALSSSKTKRVSINGLPLFFEPCVFRMLCV